VADQSSRHAMSLPHIRHGDCKVIPRGSEDIWTNDDGERVRSHLVEFLIVGDLVQVLKQPFQEVEIRGGEFAEEVSDVRQTRLKAFDFLNVT